MRNRILATVTVGVLGIFSSAVAQPTPGQTAPKAKSAAATAGSGYIGVMLQEIDGERAKVLKLREEAGVEITRVEPDSPADKAGLKSSDVVLNYNGQRVEGMEQFKRLVGETPAGREAKLEIWRNGAPQTIMVKIGMRRAPAVIWGDGSAMVMPAPMEHMDIHIPDMPRSFMTWRSSALGVEAESLEGQLAQYFGVKEGVLVRSVIKGSAAEKAGIKAGDVILRVDDTKIASPSELSNRLRALRGKTVSVVAMRDHKETTFSVTISTDDHSEWFLEGNGMRLAPHLLTPTPSTPIQ